jgi:pyruvate dehydrogenase E2 component (dihydrolipoamide acetyltransferase)
MATAVTLPELGPGIESADILDIFVKVGDTIKKDQDIIEVETDKATVPIPSSVAGKVVKIHVAKQQSVKVGGVLIEVDAVAGATAPPPKPTPSTSTAREQASAPPKVIPSRPESRSPAEAARVSSPQVPAYTSPPHPVPAPVAPSVPQPVSTSTPVVTGGGVSSSGTDLIAAGPVIRRLAREMGVDLRDVVGTGPGNRITREDVLECVRRTNQAIKSATSSSAGRMQSDAQPRGATSLPSSPERPGTAGTDEYGSVRVDRMSKVRRTIATQMQRSWTSVARVTNFDDADITELEHVRSGSKDDYASQGLKLTTMPFLIKAVATALRHHTTLNASIDAEKEEIVYHDYVNIGIAVDTERGLVVPVLRNADRMAIADIVRELAALSAKVRSGQFAVHELRGGTFTISNLGAIGGTYSTPIVNVPEVAILLVGRSRKMPVVMPNDSIQPRLMMPLSLSYDHRLVDGGDAARFLNDIKGYLETPTRLLIAL